MNFKRYLLKDLTVTLLLAFVLFSAGSVVAQKVWSLNDCINYALDNNIQIKQKMLQIETQEEELLQSKLSLLPDLNAYASHGYNWGQTIDRFTNQFATERVRQNNFYASTQMTIFRGFQEMNTVKRNKLSLLATKYDTDRFMDDISVNIATYYLQVLYNMEALLVAEAQLEVTEQQLDRTRKLVEAGTLARGDLYTVEARLATEELAVVQAKNNLDLSYLDLTQLLDLPSPEGFAVEQPDIEVKGTVKLLPEADQVYDIAVEQRPEIKSAETRVLVSDKDYDIARGGISPHLYVSGSWGTGYSGASKVGVDPFTQTIPIGYTANDVMVFRDVTDYRNFEVKDFWEQIDANNNRSFMVHLSIPIFNGWQTNSSIQRAKIARRSSEYDLELAKLNLNKTINQAYSDAKAAFKSYRAAMKKVEATTTAFQYAEEKFNVGMINSLEYNEAKKELTKAQSEMLNAKFEYIFTMTILDFYMGNPISLEKYKD